jgi:hypothetical protein
MSAELQVIRASEFICLDPNEHMDFEASKKELQKLARACWKRGLNRALLDLRGLPVLPKPHFNTEEVAALVGTFRDAGFSRKQRLAVLYEHDVYGIIRNFTFFSRLRGLQVQSFLNYEKAMNWLSGDPESSPESKHGTEVPIVKRKVKKRPTNSTARRPRTSTPRTTQTKIKGLGASRLSSN